jgi:hypothetical protein
MLRTGREHLEKLRDDRVVYIGGEKVEDVTSHPAFAHAAATAAAIYDMKADPANRDNSPGDLWGFWPFPRSCIKLCDWYGDGCPDPEYGTW